MFGYANPEGIATGAFWFYYKYGFRPVNKELLRLAGKEYNKKRADKNYRTAEKTLIRFTQSNLALNLGNAVSTDVPEITGRVLAAIKKAWPHNYAEARERAMNEFCKKAGMNDPDLDICQSKVLEEVALWAMAMKVTSRPQLQLLKDMIFTKPNDLYAYQDLLLAFFKK